MSTTVTWKIICCQRLAPPVSFYNGWKYSPCCTEWIDVFYNRICGNILMVWSRSSMISMHHKVAETANSQKQTKARLLYYMVTTIEYKCIYLEAWPKYRARYIQCISNSSPSTMNKWKSVLQALLTCICLTNECVICRLTPIVSV